MLRYLQTTNQTNQIKATKMSKAQNFGIAGVAYDMKT